MRLLVQVRALTHAGYELAWDDGYTSVDTSVHHDACQPLTAVQYARGVPLTVVPRCRRKRCRKYHRSVLIRREICETLP